MAAVTASAVGGWTTLPLTSTVGVAVTPRCTAWLVSWPTQGAYRESRTQAANAGLMIPALPAMSMRRSSDSPGPPSAGWAANNASPYGLSLPASDAQPAEAAAWVEYPVGLE